MNTTDLISIIVDKDAAGQERIEAIKQLDVIRSREKEERRRGVIHLGELSGQEALRRVIQRQRDQLEVRCHAASVAAKTDSKSALEWCNEMIQRYC